ncbi:hypothetical protein AVEN_47244-1 [Araneus ventricosus]|uniref:Uncharacterized protein n=1 Tax=Araneus ventricosus TaxID=182803 RepID=A0A4Y2ULA0_ARAVE|nr:hypothetical protein AVEN_47244-1 [Araneus ventricosus]
MGCNMSLKIHFLHPHLEFYPENLGSVSDEHGEWFHQDISNMGARYHGKWNPKMLADYFLNIENGYSSSQAQSTGQVHKKVKKHPTTPVLNGLSQVLQWHTVTVVVYAVGHGLDKIRNPHRPGLQKCVCSLSFCLIRSHPEHMMGQHETVAHHDSTNQHLAVEEFAQPTRHQTPQMQAQLHNETFYRPFTRMGIKSESISSANTTMLVAEISPFQLTHKIATPLRN